MNAAAQHLEIDAQREHGTPGLPLVLVRAEEQSLRPANPATDGASMSELWRVQGPALMRFALKLALGDRQRAEDVVQETLIRAWRHPEVVSGHVETVRPWLFTLARHLAIDLWRAQSRHDGIIDMIENQPNDQPNPVERIEQAMTAIDVRAAIARLAPIHQDVIMKMYYFDQSVREIAQPLGVPEGTIKSRSYYALRHLKRLLQPS